MSSAIAEEHHAPPSPWSKAKNFLSLGSSKRQSSQRMGPAGTPSGIVESHERVDDDAQDEAGSGRDSQRRQPQATGASSAPLSSSTPQNNGKGVTEAAVGRGSQDSSRSVPDARDAQREIEVVRDGKDDESAEVEDACEEVAVIEFLHKGAPYFWLHNHFAIPVYYDNIRYPSSEHLFQSLKFPHRPEIAKAIRKAESPSEATRTARKYAADARKGWRQDGLNIIAMREVLMLKFTQHSDLKRRLLQTGDAELLLASPSDVFWGIGRTIGSSSRGLGRNELGKALMKTRESLLATAGLGWGSGAKTV